VAFLACVHLALFLALSLSPGNSLDLTVSNNARKPFSGRGSAWSPLGELTALPQNPQLVWRGLAAPFPQEPNPRYRSFGSRALALRVSAHDHSISGIERKGHVSKSKVKFSATVCVCVCVRACVCVCYLLLRRAVSND